MQIVTDAGASAGRADQRGARLSSLHLAHQKKAKSHKKEKRQPIEQEQHPIRTTYFFDFDLDTFFAEALYDGRRGLLEKCCGETAIGAHIMSPQIIARLPEVHRHFFDLTSLHFGHEFVVADFVSTRTGPI